MKIGELNRNRQRLLERTLSPSTTHRFAKIWVLECGDCGRRYGCNSCDAHSRLCPHCNPKAALGEPIQRSGRREQERRSGPTAPAAEPTGRPVTPATPNEQIVERYMEGFRRTDRELILSCLTDDVEWEIPGAFHVHGKEAFAGHIVDEGFEGRPEITVTRLTEADDVVVAEGAVRAPRTDGTVMNLVYCDVFEMRGGKIRRLVSYLMQVT